MASDTEEEVRYALLQEAILALGLVQGANGEERRILRTVLRQLQTVADSLVEEEEEENELPVPDHPPPAVPTRTLPPVPSSSRCPTQAASVQISARDSLSEIVDAVLSGGEGIMSDPEEAKATMLSEMQDESSIAGKMDTFRSNSKELKGFEESSLAVNDEPASVPSPNGSRRSSIWVRMKDFFGKNAQDEEDEVSQTPPAQRLSSPSRPSSIYSSDQFRWRTSQNMTYLQNIPGKDAAPQYTAVTQHLQRLFGNREEMELSKVQDAPKTQQERIVEEILHTEEAYVAFLDLLFKHFYIPMKEEGASEGVSSGLVRDLYSNIGVLLECNRKLFERMKGSDGDCSPLTISRAFLEMAPFLKVYTQYVSEYDNAIHALAEISLMSSARQFVEKCAAQFRAEANSSIGLCDLLIMPIQRVPRYVMLLEALSKEVNGCEKERIEEARKTVQSIAVHINETKRKREHMMKVMEIQEEMRGNLENLVEPFRIFVREGTLWKSYRPDSEEDGREFYVVLFNDLLLFCCRQNESAFSKGEVLVYHSFLCMDEIEMDEQREDEEGSRSFVLIVQNFLGRPRTPLKLTAPTVEEKRFWLADIKKCFGWVSDTTHHTPLPHRAFGERHMCGTLLKRGDKIKSWRPRYFRHVGDKLEYFLESCEEEILPRGEFNLPYFSLKLGVEEPSKLMFELRPLEEFTENLQEVDQNRSYFFMIKDDAQDKESYFAVWLTSIAISCSDVHPDVFERYPHIHPNSAVDQGLLSFEEMRQML